MQAGLSYWEREIGLQKPDMVVIGAGITGLSAALELKKQHPDWDVLVIERGYLPTGASTKNAGFACFGSLSELQDDINTIGWEATLHLVRRRWRGLQNLRQLLGDAALDFKACGGFELFQSHQQEAYKAACALLPQMNDRLKAMALDSQKHEQENDMTDFLEGDVFAKRPTHRAFARHFGMIENRLEGSLNPGMMMQALLLKAQKVGVRFMWGQTVNSCIKSRESWQINLGNTMEICAFKVLVCTNGLAQQLLNLPVKPVRNQVLITEPIESLRWQGTFHLERGYFYFRNVGKRILIGGGRHLAGEGENTAEFGITPGVQEQLEKLVHNLILPNQRFAVAHRWSGILGVGDSRTPLMQEYAPGLFCAVRLGGMGVALGSLLGKEAATMVMEK